MSSAARVLHIEGTEWVSCDLCGADESVVVFDHCRDRLHGLPGTFVIVRCTRCGLLYVNPRPDRTSIAAYYPEEYLVHNPGAFPQQGGRVRNVLRTLSRLPYVLRYGRSAADLQPAPSSSKLLDLGCGAGEYLAEMSRLGWDCYGLEPALTAAQKARARLGDPARVTVGRADDTELEPDRFDCIRMWHVLEHVHSPRAALRNAFVALREGGILRIAVPNCRSFEARLFGARWYALEVPRHLFHFSQETLEAYLRLAGFKILRIGVQWFPSSISDSLNYMIEDITGRRWRRPEHWATYYLMAPLASLSYLLGNRGILEVTAVKPRRSGGR